MKKLTIFLLILLAAAFPEYAQNKSLQSKILDYQKTKLLKNSTWSLHAKYLDTDDIIISLNQDQSVAPASGLKVFTSAAALDYLGEDYKFVTKIFYDGAISSGGTLEGNIYISGGGDPALGSGLLKGSLPLDELIAVWIDAIRASGIKMVEGSITADNSLYDDKPIPDHWNYIDIGNYYGMSSGALTINENLYHLYFKPSKIIGEEAEVLRTEPEIPCLSFINHMKTGKPGSGDNGYIFNAPQQFNATLRGTIPAGVDEFSIKGSIPDPPLFTAQFLTRKLIESNIKVTGEAKRTDTPVEYDKTKLITETFSPPIKDIVFLLNKKSNNLYAELLLKAIGLKVHGKGSTENGAQAVADFLKINNINIDALSIQDGSGLSRTNCISSRMMTELLSALTKKKYFTAFYNSLGIVGKADDISSYRNLGRGTSLENNARMKSGGINGVRSYSGYLKDGNNRTIVFSFIANNFNGAGSAVNKIHLELMRELADLK